jgi:hypothetical protein
MQTVLSKRKSLQIEIESIRAKLKSIEMELSEISKLRSSKNGIKKQELKNILVIDGLMYQKFPSHTLYTWEEAMEYPDGLSISGYVGWRLPTIEELERLFIKQVKLNSKGDSHYIMQEFLENMPRSSRFWSSSEENEPYAWVADFTMGYDYWRIKSLKYHALFVRDI